MKTSHPFETALDRMTGCLQGLGATDIRPHVDNDAATATFEGLYDGEPFIYKLTGSDLRTAEHGCQGDWDALRRRMQATWPT
ncbi:MAG TPA: hypothetical protein DEH78_31115 [Solibacterales bacterium]|nr:hypothetical protein [Bryobacterales bacterium]